MVIWRVGNSLYRLVVVAFLLLLIWAASPASVIMAESAPPEQGEFETMILSPEALVAPTILTGAVRDAKNPKLDSSMAAMAQAAQNSIAAAAVVADSQSLRLSEGRVSSQITIHAPALNDVVKTVTELGGEVTSVGYNDTLIQAWIPVDALETLAADENVYFVRRPAEAVLLDGPDTVDATTQGLAVINGPAWHSAGHTGSGVKVGIIDGGFIGYAGLLGTDLPSSVRVSNFVDGQSDAQVDGTTPHGTAVAEIIHDIAPDAALYLAKVNTALDLEQAVNWLKETHSVDVISTSIGWYNVTPGDGTGFFADLVAGARSADILWATAAGNERESHWGGGYVDSDSDDIHEFNGQEVNYFGPGDGDCYAIEAGYGLPVFLSWDDWDDVNQDYDLLLLRWNGSGWEIIAAGEDLQTGLPGQTPTEVAYSPSFGSATCYGFVIRRYNATRNVHFEVFAPAAPHLDEFTPQRSLVNLADAPAAMTVAALDVTSPYPQESYSSEGPTNGPGGTATGGIAKPDIAAFANVATESYEGSTFNGTSSATPHVSGAAALVLSAYPSYSADQLQSLLEERAIDIGPSGMDTRFGHGRLHLGAPTPPQNDGPEISVSPTTLSVAQARDSQTNSTLSISNIGDEALTWTIGESQTGEAGCASPTSISWLSANPVSGSTPATSDSSVTVTFDSTGLTPNTYTGALCIDSNDPDTPLVSISVQQIVQDTSTAADLAVSIVDVVDPVKQGDNIEYTVTVDNLGPDPAIAAQVTNALPADVTFIPALSSTSCVLSGGEVACTLGTLAGGSNEDVTIVVRTNTNTPASVANTVEVESSTYDPISSNNSAVEITAVKPAVFTIYLPMVRTLLLPPDTLEATEDTTVLEGLPTLNVCNTNDMWAGYDLYYGAYTVRSLIKFDLSEIPPGTQIASATLNVRHYGSVDTSRDHALPITSFRVGSPWSSCSTTWNNQPSIGEAYGSVAVPFDTGNWYSIDVTGMLQGWVNGAFPNHGLWLRGPETPDNPAFRAFYTEDSSYEPYLSIAYTGATVTTQTEREVVDDERKHSESILTVADLLGVPSLNQMCQDIPEGFECMTTP